MVKTTNAPQFNTVFSLYKDNTFFDDYFVNLRANYAELPHSYEIKKTVRR